MPFIYRKIRYTDNLPYSWLACRRAQKPKEKECLDRKFLLQGLLTVPQTMKERVESWYIPRLNLAKYARCFILYNNQTFSTPPHPKIEKHLFHNGGPQCGGYSNNKSVSKSVGNHAMLRKVGAYPWEAAFDNGSRDFSTKTSGYWSFMTNLHSPFKATRKVMLN